MIAGVIIIYTGLALFCLGLGSIGSYAYAARKAHVKGWIAKSALAITLLTSNLPVALGLVSAALYIMSTDVVLVNNKSDFHIEEIVLHDPVGVSYQFGSVAAWSRRKVTFHFGGEGAVTYSLNVAGKIHSGILLGYITSGLGSAATMTINKDGTVDVQEHF